MAETDPIVVWEPRSKPQYALVTCPVYEVFFGGARGGGKTDGVLGEWIEHAFTHGKHAIGLMIRRTLVELTETIERSKALYTPLGWQYHEQQKMWRTPDGARLRFAYLERDSDADGYMGHSYTRLYIEEIGNFPNPAPIFKLFATLRSGAGVPVGVRATGNPGGAGHTWVKRRYIDPAPNGWRVISDSLTGLERVFIPSKIADNPFLNKDDQYKNQIRASGSRELVQAWLEGDWNIVAGAYFDCWDNRRHVVKPFTVPASWLRFRAMDWGSASPFSIGWWAVVGDDFLSPDGVTLPRGAIVCYREWHGVDIQPNGQASGLKLNAAEIANGIIEREGADQLKYGVLDPATFNVTSGPSIGEEINSVLLKAKKAQFQKADNKRIAKDGAISGWDQMRKRLVGNDDGHPMIACFSTCEWAINTIPSLQHDADNPEDLDTDGDDHAADMWRYACMSRPWVPHVTVQEKPRHLFGVQKDGVVRSSLTFNEIIKRQERKHRR